MREERKRSEKRVPSRVRGLATANVQNDDAYSHMVELPVSLDLTVVAIVPNQQEMLHQIMSLHLPNTVEECVKQQNCPCSSPADRVAVASSPVHLASPGRLTAQSSPSTPVIPSTTLQLSVATPNRNKHRHFLASQHPILIGIEDDQPPNDYAAIHR